MNNQYCAASQYRNALTTWMYELLVIFVNSSRIITSLCYFTVRTSQMFMCAYFKEFVQ